MLSSKSLSMSTQEDPKREADPHHTIQETLFLIFFYASIVLFMYTCIGVCYAIYGSTGVDVGRYWNMDGIGGKEEISTAITEQKITQESLRPVPNLTDPSNGPAAEKVAEPIMPGSFIVSENQSPKEPFGSSTHVKGSSTIDSQLSAPIPSQANTVVAPTCTAGADVSRSVGASDPDGISEAVSERKTTEDCVALDVSASTSDAKVPIDTVAPTDTETSEEVMTSSSPIVSFEPRTDFSFFLKPNCTTPSSPTRPSSSFSTASASESLSSLIAAFLAEPSTPPRRPAPTRAPEFIVQDPDHNCRCIYLSYLPEFKSIRKTPVVLDHNLLVPPKWDIGRKRSRSSRVEDPDTATVTRRTEVAAEADTVKKILPAPPSADASSSDAARPYLSPSLRRVNASLPTRQCSVIDGKLYGPVSHTTSDFEEALYMARYGGPSRRTVATEVLPPRPEVKVEMFHEPKESTPAPARCQTTPEVRISAAADENTSPKPRRFSQGSFSAELNCIRDENTQRIRRLREVFLSYRSTLEQVQSTCRRQDEILGYPDSVPAPVNAASVPNQESLPVPEPTPTPSEVSILLPRTTTNDIQVIPSPGPLSLVDNNFIGSAPVQPLNIVKRNQVRRAYGKENVRYLPAFRSATVVRNLGQRVYLPGRGRGQGMWKTVVQQSVFDDEDDEEDESEDESDGEEGEL